MARLGHLFRGSSRVHIAAFTSRAPIRWGSIYCSASSCPARASYLCGYRPFVVRPPPFIYSPFCLNLPALSPSVPFCRLTAPALRFRSPLLHALFVFLSGFSSVSSDFPSPLFSYSRPVPPMHILVFDCVPSSLGPFYCTSADAHPVLLILPFLLPSSPLPRRWCPVRALSSLLVSALFCSWALAMAAPWRPPFSGSSAPSLICPRVLPAASVRQPCLSPLHPPRCRHSWSDNAYPFLPFRPRGVCRSPMAPLYSEASFTRTSVLPFLPRD